MGIPEEKFLEGEVYRNKRTESYRFPSDHIFVVGVDSSDASGVLLAIFWVEAETMNMIEPGEIFIETHNFDKWERVELV